MIVVDNTEALRDWLVEELEPVCDADPVVLAKYILALVKRDKEEDALRTKCLTSLDVFLAKETPAFVDKLIHTLITQSYIQEEYDPTEWSGSINKEPEKEPSPPGTHEENDEKPETPADAENLDVPDGNEDPKESPEVDKKPESKKRERSLSTISSASEHEKRSKSRSKSNSKDRVSSKVPKNKKRPAGRRQVVDDRPKRKKPRDDKGKIIKRKRKDKLKKCPDYEEKGFCKKGDSCPFDHGSDPFKVDKLPTDSFISPMFPPPFGAFPPPPAMPFPFPPPGLLNVPPPPPGLEMFAKALPFLPAPQNGTLPQQQPETTRPPKRQANENIISLTQSQPRNPGNSNNHNNFKRPKYVPWNKGKGTPDNTTLEIRRIPLEMNTEEKLREHFAKFGEVETVTVGISGDQQASIIKFTTHAAARSACSAPEPVFNNRFIALFWYAGSSGVQSENQTPVASTATENNAATNGNSEQSQNQPPAFPKKPAATRAQRLALARSHMLGGHNNQAQIEAEEARKQQKIDSSLKQIQAQEEARKKKEEERKSAIKLKTSLIEQKRELLSKFVEEQKKLLEKLEKGKSTLSANDKKLILTTLKSLEESCAKLRGEIDQLLNAAKPKPTAPPKPPPAAKLLSSSPLMKHKRETQKELLDAELELLTDKNAEEKLQLQKRLIELKREAVQLGVLGRGKPGFPGNLGTTSIATPGSTGGGALTSGYSPFSSFLNSQYQNRAQNPGFGSLPTPSHPVLQQQLSQSSPTADNRPKTIKVSGFDLDEKDEVITHFSKLGKVESKWEDIDTGVLYFEYRNRIDSLNAAQKGFKFKNKTLTVHWHRGAHRNSSASLDDSGASSLNTSNPNSSSLGSLSNPPSFIHQLSSGQSPGSSTSVAGGVTNTHELARVRMESRDSSFSALMTEDDEEEAERLWRMTANATY